MSVDNPEQGKTVTIDLENNYAQSLRFIQDNGAYILWSDQRKRMEERLND